MLKLFILTSIITAGLMLGTGGAVFAYVMSSPNYRIQSDSLNVGGLRQTSANYFSEDTIGETATGFSSSTTYNLYAGYQQMESVYLAISVTATVTLSPSIGGLSGGQANGSTTVTVISNNPAGYSLSVNSSVAPALATSSYSFADYTPLALNTADYTWSIVNSDSEFGFSMESPDAIQKYKNNGLACGVGLNNTANACWFYFSTTTESIARSNSSNYPAGAATVINLRAESGVNHTQVAGDYKATIVFTAVSN